MIKRAFSLIAVAVSALFGNCFCPSANAKLIDLTTDGTGSYNVTAENLDVTIAGTTVHAMVYRDRSPGAPVPVPADGIPIPVIRLTPGQMVTCNFKSLLSDVDVPEGASIHWHGIELDNDSDGTAVTQDSLRNGQTYTYRFIAPRPGIYWFHSHMVPGDTLWAGMYGIMIVTSPCETALIPSVLPSASATFALAMTDIEYLTSNFTNTAGATGMVFTAGTVGRSNSGQFQTINGWIEACALAGPGASGPNGACTLAAKPGNTVLVNGYNPNTTPAPLTFNVQTGQVVRLQLFNEALTRTFYLKLDPTNTQQLVRIGGMGGLLNNARVEGGNAVKGQPTDAGWNTFYDPGSIILSSGMRADVVTTIPANATNGQKFTLWGEPVPAGSPWPLTQQAVGAPYPIAFFTVVAGAPANNPPPIVNGTTILSGGCQVTSLTNGASNIKTNFMNPPPGLPGSTAGTIILNNGASSKPAIDGLDLAGKNTLDGNMGNGEVWTKEPPLTTDRYAHIGDLYVLAVQNATGGGGGSATLAHPFHLHGWSIQPLAMLDNATGNVLYTYNYNEFLDTIEVYGGQTLVFSVRIDDHQTFCDKSSGTPPTPGPILHPCTSGTNGGALGRWLYHCHIGAHGVLGMMAEVVVVDDTPQKVVWLQPPNLTTNGVDVLATAGAASQTVADDFRTNGPFSSISIWGSWTNDVVDANAAFEIKFWTDVPVANGPFSRPGWQAWRQMFPAGTYTNFLVASNIINETFYNPAAPAVGIDTKVYRYDFMVPTNQAFNPTSGYTNWISVTAYTSTNTVFFGWKSSVTNAHYNDDGAWSSTLYGPPWTDLHYPAGNIYAPTSMDLAFQLGVPNPPGGREAPIGVPVLTVTITDGNVNISWSNGGILQSADAPSGPWIDIGGIPNPYVAPAGSPHQFYRVRVPQ